MDLPAKMNPETKSVDFTTDWKIQWSEYDSITNQPDGIRKYFVTPFNNLPLRWFAELGPNKDKPMLEFHIYYDDGPTKTIDGVEFEISVVKNGAVSCQKRANLYQADRRFGRGWSSFEDKDSTAVRQKYGLTDADLLVYQITIKIPVEAFESAKTNPETKFVNFSTQWKIQWSEYDSIVKSRYIRKYFVIAYNNIPLRWLAELEPNKDKPMLEFFVYYDDGPMETIDGVEFEIGVVKTGAVLSQKRKPAYEAKRGQGDGWKSFEDKDSAAVRTKYGLTDADLLVYQISVKIPIEAFESAKTNPETKFVNFSTQWKIQWSEYDSISSQPIGIQKDFVTTYNNITLRWTAQLLLENMDNPTIGFYNYYDDGPLEKIDGVQYTVDTVVGVVKTGGVSWVYRTFVYQAKRGWFRGWKSFEDKDSAAVRTKYGLNDTDLLEYQITIKIPVEAFSYVKPMPTPKPSESILVSLLESSSTMDQPAKMNLDTKFVYFSMEWKIQWSEYDSLNGQVRRIQKDFVTAYNNIPLRWFAYIQQNTDDKSQLTFRICYNDGPMEKINGVQFEIGAVKNGDVSCQKRTNLHEAERGFSYGWTSFEDTDSAAVRAEYGLTTADRLVYQIMIKIPVGTFSYSMPMPTAKPSEPFLVYLFGMIDDPSKADFADAKLISRDDVVYYCHKNVIGTQSEPLASLLRGDPLTTQAIGAQQHPPASATEHVPPQLLKRESNQSTSPEDQPKKKDGEYDFPTMAGASLKSMVEYMYTGNATMANLSVTELIELTDAAGQYAVNSLYKSCGVELWKRVVSDPQSAYQIVSFADLHDMKYLKDRAFDIIIENMVDSTSIRFGGTRSKELRDEFILYSTRRLSSYIKP